MSNQERIVLKVVSDNVELGHFITEKTTEFFQLMRAATLRVNVTMDGMRFIYNGHIIKAADTPGGLGMQSGQVIKVEMTDPANFPTPE